MTAPAEGGVPRETRARELLLELAGTRAPAVEIYAELLLGPGIERGLLGPREGARLWERHLLNSATPASLLTAGETVVDVGSGAGLPGIPLALVAPACPVTLLEPLLRRTRFLDEAVSALELTGQVEVLRGRAEEVRRRQWHVVTARAVAPLEALARLARPLLPPGGRLLALKGAAAREELDALSARLPAVGFASGRVVQCGPEDLPTTVVELVAAAGGTKRW